MSALGVAVIGHGFMGRAHSAAWRNAGAAFGLPHYRQQVLVGRSADAVAAAAAAWGWQESATDWRAVLARDDIQIVDICTPGWAHAEIAIAALRAGKHVIVEKPLANSVDEAEQMVEVAAAAARRGVFSMVGFNYRRVPAIALARELIAAGRLGTVRQVRASYLQDWLADDNAPMSWRLRAETAGSGALGDIASHAVDLVQFVLTEQVMEASGALRTFVPQRPGGAGGAEEVTVDDAVWANLRLSGGASASIEASRIATGRKNSLHLEIYGSRGALRFDLERLNELEFFDAMDPLAEQGFRRILVTEPEHPYLKAWWPQGHILGWEHSFSHQVRDFLDCIDQGRAPSPSFAEGLQVQRVLGAIAESSDRNGIRIAV
ncbi:Gfo/Idh/MocA family protein [Arthrobacter russicus]|uniref:Dehydrogenase n=1 Tax=Arthrobacter russicus TaxID=172040 RepID=A0ABU1JAE0_9MICC|nr:Gfo/Idh/MocA family oxidoreductase [Arthrobacter russicus]MDR6269385.1 putative dehydrogenase [Arthrobacter russicus]